MARAEEILNEGIAPLFSPEDLLERISCISGRGGIKGLTEGEEEEGEEGVDLKWFLCGVCSTDSLKLRTIGAEPEWEFEREVGFVAFAKSWTEFERPPDARAGGG